MVYKRMYSFRYWLFTRLIKDFLIYNFYTQNRHKKATKNWQRMNMLKYAVVSKFKSTWKKNTEVIMV